jgi:hypothetical protein
MVTTAVAQILFVVLLAASLAFFARTVWLFGRGVAAGAPDPRPRFDQLGGRLLDVGIYFFGQKKVAEEGPQHQSSKHHLLIFWGFLLITIGTADTVVSGVIPSLTLSRLPSVIYRPLYTAIDIFSLIVLVTILWGVARRTLVRPALIPWNLDAGLILGSIGALMVTYFLIHGYQIAGELSANGDGASAWPIAFEIGS